MGTSFVLFDEWKDCCPKAEGQLWQDRKSNFSNCSCSLLTIKKSTLEIQANCSTFFSTKNWWEKYFHTSGEKKEKERYVKFSQRHVSCSVRKISSKAHDPPSIWFLFSVSQDAPICVTHYFYNPYLIIYGSLRVGPAKGFSQEVLDLLPSYYLCIHRQGFSNSQRLTFPIWKMGIIVDTNLSCCYEH